MSYKGHLATITTVLGGVYFLKELRRYDVRSHLLQDMYLQVSCPDLDLFYSTATKLEVSKTSLVAILES